MKFVGRKFEGEEIRRGMIKEMTVLCAVRLPPLASSLKYDAHNSCDVFITEYIYQQIILSQKILLGRSEEYIVLCC